jgi:hypothetical protein
MAICAHLTAEKKVRAILRGGIKLTVASSTLRPRNTQILNRDSLRCLARPRMLGCSHFSQEVFRCDRCEESCPRL